MVTPSGFFATFTKGNNFHDFLFSSLVDDDAQPKWVCSQRKEFALSRAKFYPTGADLN